MPLSNILKELSEDFERMVKLFPTEDWRFYKFGLGGPHKRALTKLTYKAKKYDQEIFDFFGAHKETVSYKSLIVLCLKMDPTPKELHSLVDTYRRCLARMRKIL